MKHSSRTPVSALSAALRVSTLGLTFIMAAAAVGCSNGDAPERESEAAPSEPSVSSSPAAPVQSPPGEPRTTSGSQGVHVPPETLRLVTAVIDNDLETVRRYLEDGGDPNIRGYRDETLLHAAARAGHAGVALLLIEHGAEIDARSDVNVTPLHWAARFGHPELCRLFVEHGADVNARGGIRRDQTPLSIAARQQYREIVEYLASVGGVP